MVGRVRSRGGRVSDRPEPQAADHRVRLPAHGVRDDRAPLVPSSLPHARPRSRGGTPGHSRSGSVSGISTVTRVPGSAAVTSRT
ncbi:hypothetical protein GCM10010360_75030 [Streptomyces nogalater]